MSGTPEFHDLARVDRGVLCGLLDEYGSPAWTANYEHRWERFRATWTRVQAAMEAATEGARPSILHPKPPAWLTAVVAEQLHELGTSSWPTGGTFKDVRLLERLELVGPPVDDAYVLAIIGGLGDRWGVLSRSAQIREDPELAGRIWRVFEVEGGGEISLANVDKFSKTEATWRTTFEELVADGTLDRSRVLTECLTALQRDFSAYRAGWFSALFESLDPSAAECGPRQAQLRALLGSSASATVSLAARRLRRVSAAGLFDDDEFAGLEPGLHARTKGATLDVIRVLGEIADRRTDLGPPVAQLVAGALSHPRADVQRAVVDALRLLGAESAAVAAADDLAPSVSRYLIGRTPPTPTPVDTPSAPAPVGSGAVPVPRSALPTDRTLLEGVAAAIEDAGDPLEVEQVLAGLAQLDRPDKLQPLAKRARQILQRGPREEVDAGWLRGRLARLVLVATGERPARLPSAPLARIEFLVRRLADVEAVLAGGRPPHILLATPDRSDGYLSPTALVRRLHECSGKPLNLDIVAAMLRLAPDGREEALRLVGGDDEVAAVARHALGAPTSSGVRRVLRIVRNRELWVAASRARAPGADDPLLLGAGLDRAGQGRPVRATVIPKAQPFTWKSQGREHRGTHWVFSISIANGARAVDPLQPTLAVGHSEAPRRSTMLEDWIPLLLATTPHDVEAPLADLIYSVFDAADGSGVSHDATRVLAGLARHPGGLGALGATALAAGLSASRHDHRVLALDAAVSFTATARLTPAGLAEAMVAFAPAATPGRWAESLADLGRAHPGTFVTEVLTALLPTLPADRRGLHALVELLREETIGRNATVADAALRHWLESLPGSGGAPRAARELLDLD